MRAASASIRRTALQRPHRKRVPQIVQTRAALRRPYDTVLPTSLSKVSLTAM